MATQTKEAGTQVPAMQAIQYETLQVYTFRNDILGVLGYQGTPVVIDAGTRDALLNGNMADIENQTNGQGMQANYIKISWNETSQINGYYITDLQIGIVATITRDFNTGPAFMIDALKAVPWLGAVIARTGMTTSNSWKAWKHLNQKRPEPYNQWLGESVSQTIFVGSMTEAGLPPLPDTGTVKASILSQGNFQQALGKFTTQMIDKGYAVTFPATNSYDVDICYEKGNVYVEHHGGPIGGYDTWNYQYKVHVRFWWEFTTDPEITTANLSEARRLFELTTTIIVGIIIAVVVAIWGSIGIYNLTTTRTEYQEWGYRYNPNTGQWEWVIVKSGSSQGPPDWWAWVVPVIALIGAGAVVYFLLPLRPKRKEYD